MIVGWGAGAFSVEASLSCYVVGIMGLYMGLDVSFKVPGLGEGFGTAGEGADVGLFASVAAVVDLEGVGPQERGSARLAHVRPTLFAYPPLTFRSCVSSNDP